MFSKHSPSDRIVGEPLCTDCYDYERAVTFNALAPELWRRVTSYTRRNLARLYGLTQKIFNREVRLSFAKIVEYQRRGVIHLHAVAGLDHVNEDSSLELNVQFLATAIEMAVAKASVPYPQGRGVARFGSQLDLQILEHGEESTHRRGVAGYVAKYATKSSDDDGVLDRKD